VIPAAHVPVDLAAKARLLVGHLRDQGLIEEGTAPLATGWCVVMSGVDASRFVHTLETGGATGFEVAPPEGVGPMPDAIGLLLGFPVTYRQHIPPGEMHMARVEWLQEIDASLSAPRGAS
jgi:hypothetical protein